MSARIIDHERREILRLTREVARLGARPREDSAIFELCVIIRARFEVADRIACRAAERKRLATKRRKKVRRG